jgi:hypothetical protein
MKKKRTSAADDRRYDQFLRRLKLFGLALDRAECHIDRAAYFALLDRRKDAARNISANYELKRVKDDFFDAVARFILEVRDEKGKREALRLTCSFILHFHGDRAVDQSLAKQFTASELRLVVWPYFRQFVSDITARMSIPPVNVPLATER